MNSTGWDLLSLFEARVENQGCKPLYSFLSRDGEVSESLSYVQLHGQAAALAAVLQSRGLTGSAVALVYSHGSEFIRAFLAAMMAGACPVPLSRARRRDWVGIEQTLRRCGARALLTTSAVRKNLSPAIQAMSGLHVLSTDTLAGDASSWRRPSLSARETCFIQYTSGSTRAPRGVVISHENILHNCSLIARAFAIDEDDIGTSWLPFHHDMGLIGHLLVPLYSGVHNYFLSARDFVASPCSWLAAISRYRSSISGGPDFAYELCVDRISEEQLATLDLSTWRIAYCGSERVRAATLGRFARRFASAQFRGSALYPCYGMAETTLFVSGRNGVHMESRSDAHCDVSVGLLRDAHADPTVRIVSPETGLECQEAQEGEIWVKSRSVARGYHGESELTAQVFNAQLEDESGFLRTGDLGYLCQQNLYFTGRLKNVIKRRGRSFHAEDIEAESLTLLQDEGVARTAAFDLDTQDGQVLVLLLELDGSQDSAGVEAKLPGLQARLWESPGILVSRIKLVRPRALPVTTSGKLQREECRERFLAGGFAHV